MILIPLFSYNLLNRYLLPLEDKAFIIRQKSGLLLPANHRDPPSGSLRRGQVLISSHHPPNKRRSLSTYSTSLNVSGSNAPPPVQENVGTPAGEGPLLQTPSFSIEEDECSSTESVSNENGRGIYPRHRPQHYHHHHQHHHTPNPRPRNLNDLSPPSNIRNTNHISGTTTTTTGVGMTIQEELLKSIRYLITKQDEVEVQNILVAEWRLVAQVVDRILFWIFFFITFVSSSFFLIIIPLYKRSWHGPNPPSS